MKRLLSLFLLLFIAISSFGANYDFQDGNGLYYKITSVDNKTCEIINPNSYDPAPYSGEITIPSSVIYRDAVYKVTGIGMETFAGCTSLTSVIVPNSVVSFGFMAFAGCSHLTSFTIPNSVTSIGEGAFYGCSSLMSIIIPNSVINIASSAFSGCI